MDFGLSQDQVLFKESLRRFLDAECPTTRVRSIMEGAPAPLASRELGELHIRVMDQEERDG